MALDAGFDVALGFVCEAWANDDEKLGTIV